MSELSKCPFCSETFLPRINGPQSLHYIKGICFYVSCPACQACGPIKETLEEAIAAWNGHTPTTPTTPSVPQPLTYPQVQAIVNLLAWSRWHVDNEALPAPTRKAMRRDIAILDDLVDTVIKRQRPPAEGGNASEAAAQHNWQGLIEKEEQE